jgi:N-carbamoylputrescine amidase
MATSPSFTVGIIQESVTNDVQKNVERAEARIREAAEKGAQIVSLQELFNAPYFCKSQKHERFDLAEPIPGPTIERMRKLARELELVIIVPIFERQ